MAPAPPRGLDELSLPRTGMLHVWWIPAATASAVDRGLLSTAERTREAALVRQEDRDRFVVGAAAVRILAGAASGTSPEAAVVHRRCGGCGGDHGPPGIPGYEISVTHSGSWVGLACGTGGLVGLDIEEVGRGDLADLAGEILAPGEVCAPSGLLTRWTRKEAVLKATGHGLRVAPTEVVVEEGPGGPRVVSFERWPEVGRWRLTALAGPPGTTSTLATWSAGAPRVVELQVEALGPTTA
ncbi:4'-phosphopantetheinyl transferase superfamily protein [Promicromonospora xylanilytica]